MIPVAKKNTVQFFFCNGVFLLKVKRFEKISGRAFAKTFFFGFDFGFFFAPNF